MREPKHPLQTASLVEDIRNNHKDAIQQIYDSCFPIVRSYIMMKNGSKDDAWDVFQDAMMVLFKKCQTSEFKLTSSVCTFLRGVSHNIWLKKRTKKNNSTVTISEDQELIDEYDLQKTLVQVEREQLFRSKLAELGDRCQKILRLFFDKIKMVEIANQLGYASDNVAKKAAFNCRKKLTTLVQNDPRYLELSYKS